MSRSAWKFLPLINTDYFVFLNCITKRFNRFNRWFPARNTTINSLNYLPKANLHQGKHFHEVNPHSPAWSYKFGVLSKTRKPFFFRSKKKRN